MCRSIYFAFFCSMSASLASAQPGFDPQFSPTLTFAISSAPVRDTAALANAIAIGDLKVVDGYIRQLVRDNGLPMPEHRSSIPSPIWRYHLASAAEHLKHVRGVEDACKELVIRPSRGSKGYYGREALIVQLRTKNGNVTRTYYTGREGAEAPKDRLSRFGSSSTGVLLVTEIE